MSVDKKFQKAKIKLLLDEPFFGSLLLNLKCVKDPACKTMCTNSADLRWGPAFVDKLTLDQVKTVLAHEVMHCALNHCLRRGSRQINGWNVACDHAANIILDQANQEAKSKGKPAPFEFPEGALMDHKYDGMSAEEIYQEQPPGQNGSDNQGGQSQSGQGQGQPQPGNGPPNGQSDSDPGGMGGVEDFPGTGDETQESDQESRWKVATLQAATLAKGQGKLPASMARLVGDILNPKTSWQEHLRRFVREYCKDDYSWTRPNPRYLQTGFILPSLHSQRLGRLAIAIDTSGSIDVPLLNTFISEVEQIAHECRPSSIVLIDCDAQVNSMREFEPSDPLPRDFHGGGGTDFSPVFDALANDAPVALVYFTDLYGSFPDSEPGYPVLWAVYGDNDRPAPFGETIKVE